METERRKKERIKNRVRKQLWAVYSLNQKHHAVSEEEKKCPETDEEQYVRH